MPPAPRIFIFLPAFKLAELRSTPWVSEALIVAVPPVPLMVRFSPAVIAV